MVLLDYGFWFRVLGFGFWSYGFVGLGFWC